MRLRVEPHAVQNSSLRSRGAWQWGHADGGSGPPCGRAALEREAEALACGTGFMNMTPHAPQRLMPASRTALHFGQR